MRELYHPSREQLSLPIVLDALSDPTRLAIVIEVAARGESVCGDFLKWGTKTNLSYHIAKLRESGILRVRINGVFRHATVRWDDLEARFPGLVRKVIATARREVGMALPETLRLPVADKPSRQRRNKGKPTAAT